MKTNKGIRIVMMSLIALMVFGYASRAFAAIDAFIWFTDSDGKKTQVVVKPDGSFATGALHAGTYKWSFGTTQSATMKPAGSGAAIASPVGSGPYSLTVTPKIQPSPSSGALVGRRMHTPVVIVRTVDKASPGAMTDLGTIVIDVNGDGVTGTVMVKNAKGGITAMDDWLSPTK